MKLAHPYQGLQWLDRYANGYHKWQTSCRDGQQCYYRPLGLVEQLFDTDGTEFEGRADVNSILTLEIRSKLSLEEFKGRLELAWTSLRLQHVLLFAKALDRMDLSSLDVKPSTSAERLLVIEQPRDTDAVLRDASQTIHFVGDIYPKIDTYEFYRHLMNTARIISPSKSLAELFVLPLIPLPNGNCLLQTILVAAHCIADGLSISMWMSHFIDILNSSLPTVADSLSTHICPLAIRQRLPSAQEDLYSQIPGNHARRRWFWVIAIILRHIRHPPPQSFRNPLFRTKVLVTARPMPSGFANILDYSRTPPLNSYVCHPTLSPRATHHLQRLCRSADVSIGSGCFALVAMAMNLLQERLDPSNTLPFTASFPVNPRPFFNYKGPADSMMLAFSDGITLPFLPTHLPLERRFIFLAKRAHRQLSVFQKRPRKATGVVALGSRNPTQLIPSLYINSVERSDAKLPPSRRRGLNPQGAYPARVGFAGATCGVSSIGPRWMLLEPGRYDLNSDDKDFIADFRDLESAVRVRDGEFLVGSGSDRDVLHFNVSYDGNALDEGKVAVWKNVMEEMLESADKKQDFDRGFKVDDVAALDVDKDAHQDLTWLGEVGVGHRDARLEILRAQLQLIEPTSKIEVARNHPSLAGNPLHAIVPQAETSIKPRYP